MRRSLLWIGVCPLIGVFPALALCIEAPDVSEPPSREIVVADSKGYPHLAILPNGYEDSSKRWPLLLFLHGGGLRDAPPERFRETELWRIAGKNDFPFLFLVPRCPSGGVLGATRSFSPFLQTPGSVIESSPVAFT